MKDLKDRVEFIGICKECNKQNEVAVPKKYIDILIPRYCTECGSKTDYSNKISSLL